MTQEPWIRRFHPEPDTSVQLVCLPHAGGSASYYFPLSRELRGDVEVLAVQYPGRQDRSNERLLDSVEALADGVADALRPWSGRPLALFGHSLGASVAYEVALRLEAASATVPALFVSGRRAPCLRRDDRVHLLPDAGLVAEIAALAGTDPAVLQDEDLVRMVLPAVRADYRAAETYEGRPGTRLSCPVHVHVGDADPRVDVDEARAWEAHTAGSFTMTVHPGGHFYLNARVDAVVASIGAQLGVAGARVRSAG